MSKATAQTTTPELFVTVKFIAARYNASAGTIWRWVRSRNFPQPVSLTPGCTRWRLSEVEAFENERAAAQAESVAG